MFRGCLNTCRVSPAHPLPDFICKLDNCSDMYICKNHFNYCVFVLKSWWRFCLRYVGDMEYIVRMEMLCLQVLRLWRHMPETTATLSHTKGMLCCAPCHSACWRSAWGVGESTVSSFYLPYPSGRLQLCREWDLETWIRCLFLHIDNVLTCFDY